MLSLLLFTLLSADEIPDYGEAYVVDEISRELPRFHLGVSHAIDFSNSYLDLHSVVGNAQVRLWKYFSTGVMGQWITYGYSDAGRQIRSLNEVDIHAEFPTPQWGVFSHSQLQFMLGKWNILNLFPLGVDLLFGGGLGSVNKKSDTHGASHVKVSYLWTAEQRFHFHEHFGIHVGVFGHLGGNYLQSGIHFQF